jgi:hypothetical protein
MGERVRRPKPIELRVRVVEPLENCMMITVYKARRKGEVGYTGFASHRPITNGRPGGSAMR